MSNCNQKSQTEQHRRRIKASAKLRLRPGKASKYISNVSHLNPGDRVIIVCRVSKRAQNHNGNLADQERNLRQRAKILGLIVVGIVTYVGSGTDPCWLARHIAKAKKTNAKFFAESTDRFIRSSYYHSKTNPDAQARESDLYELYIMTGGMELVTDINPAATPSEVRSYQRIRGQKMKGKENQYSSMFSKQKIWKKRISEVRKSLPLSGYRIV